MIFASDLDRTLIHPLAELWRCGEPTPPVRVVEVYEGQAVSCMSETSIALLHRLAGEALFIPVTTRSVEQYRRVRVVSDLARVAVTCNGGVILRDGVPDPVWARRMDAALRDAASLDRAEAVILDAVAGTDWLLRHKRVDPFFWYGIVDLASLPVGAPQDLHDRLTPHGWVCVLHGRKLYALPRCVNKWDAVAHIVSEHPGRAVAAAGDSILDECLVRAPGVAGYTPAAGELAAVDVAGLTVTAAPHVLGSDEMLAAVLATSGSPLHEGYVAG